MNFRASALHPVLWLAWIVCTCTTVIVFANPLADVFIVALCFVMSVKFAYSIQRKKLFSFVMLMISLFSLFRIALLLLTTHGTGHVFATVPSVTVPRVLGGYQLGGSLELPVLLQTLNESLL